MSIGIGTSNQPSTSSFSTSGNVGIGTSIKQPSTSGTSGSSGTSGNVGIGTSIKRPSTSSFSTSGTSGSGGSPWYKRIFGR